MPLRLPAARRRAALNSEADMSARQMLEVRRAEREALIQRVTILLKDDERVVGAWLAGSLGRGEADDLSDVDLWLAVADEHCPAIVAGRRDYVARLGRPLLLEDAPQNAPAGGGYLLVLYPGQAGPQHVDWYWQPRSAARLPTDAQLLFERERLPRETPLAATRIARAEALDERVAFFWAMSNIAAKYVARREPCAALRMLELVGEALTDVRDMVGGEGKDVEIDSALPALQPVHQLALLRSLAAGMEALTPRIVAVGGRIPVQAILQIYRFFDLAAELVEESALQRVE